MLSPFGFVPGLPTSKDDQQEAPSLELISRRRASDRLQRGAEVSGFGFRV